MKNFFKSLMELITGTEETSKPVEKVEPKKTQGTEAFAGKAELKESKESKETKPVAKEKSMHSAISKPEVEGSYRKRENVTNTISFRINKAIVQDSEKPQKRNSEQDPKREKNSRN